MIAVYSLLASLAVVAFAAVVSTVMCRFFLLRRKDRIDDSIVVGFFHPRCGGGGGGERVLWKAIEALTVLGSESIKIRVVVYTIDPPSATYKTDLLSDVRKRFSISLLEATPISFVHLHEHGRHLEHSSFLSLLVEAWGTMVLAYLALRAWTPDVFLDTTGCAFTYPVARILAGCRVGAYVHYPTISTDMLSLVFHRRPTYNNDPRLSNSVVRTGIKLIYYLFFAFWYGVCGSMAQLVMVNSSWTFGHISFLWRPAARRVRIVFPPCDVSSCRDLPLTNREQVIVSIGQFRPEKDHALQIASFSLLKKKYPETGGVKLVLIGGCRNRADETRVEELKELATTLNVSDSVSFVINQPYSVVKEWYARASVGLHTMWNEHFGIGVVEMMAAGLLVVAHKSGGPKTDIVVPLNGERTGFLSSNPDEYADAICEALKLEDKAELEMRKRARESAERFSDDVFSKSFKLTLLESGIFR